MEDFSKEQELHQILQATGKLPRRVATKEQVQKRQEKKLKKKLKKSQRGYMNEMNLFFQEEERQIYRTVYDDVEKLVIEQKGKVTAIDAMIINDLCIARIRVFRKARMESNFNRFMDRVAPQDPQTQSLQCMKALGLLSDKKTEASNKDMLAKALGKEAIDSNGDLVAIEFSREQWEKEQDGFKVSLQSMTPENPNTSYNDTFADLEGDDLVMGDPNANKA